MEKYKKELLIREWIALAIIVGFFAVICIIAFFSSPTCKHKANNLVSGFGLATCSLACVEKKKSKGLVSPLCKEVGLI